MTTPKVRIVHQRYVHSYLWASRKRSLQTSGIGLRIYGPIPPVAENYPILIDRVFAQNLANQLGRVDARNPTS